MFTTLHPRQVEYSIIVWCNPKKRKDTYIQEPTYELPYLLTREQASKFLGIDPKSFDKYIRASDDLERFMIGRQERYTVSSISKFVKTHSI
ncbi:DNA-binding protein [Listeria seeligeri]|uniref:DNA-binding protein n=1 Tax=Listeria seeligeri TaxID=1640 RepID=UPI000A400B3B|nr:DNA-binding protein [Listeria seeligeri]